ncbi:hypothetical protein A5674_18280 [Mycobacterium malmoense]|nr:hypothetical protein A5674_18280 [Mycobacterium malmoense]
MLDDVTKKDHCEFRADFANRFPTSIFLDMFGAPSEDLPQFLLWESEVLHLSPEEDPDYARATTAMLAVMAYMSDLIEARRKDPRDDIVSHSLDWRIDHLRNPSHRGVGLSDHGGRAGEPCRIRQHLTHQLTVGQHPKTLSRRAAQYRTEAL